jgi:hypothetical protein
MALRALITDATGNAGSQLLDRPRRLLGTALRGASAGIIATAAMSLVMLSSRRLGLVSKVAPEHIAEAGLDAAGMAGNERAENAASTVAHLVYGAANGALFAFMSHRLSGPPAARGLAFAGALLLVSYEGWVPAARILPPLHAQTAGGRWTLIAGHAVYGAVLGRLAT